MSPLSIPSSEAVENCIISPGTSQLGACFWNVSVVRLARNAGIDLNLRTGAVLHILPSTSSSSLRHRC